MTAAYQSRCGMSLLALCILRRKGLVQSLDCHFQVLCVALPKSMFGFAFLPSRVSLSLCLCLSLPLLSLLVFICQD